MHTYNAPHLLEVRRRMVKGTDRVVTYADIGGLAEYTIRDVPRKYRSICYAGQRKLLFGEIQFLLANLSRFEDDQPKTVLYIGSAPGNHIVPLSIMFPEVKFILYDGRKHCDKLNLYAEEHPERIEINLGLYTAETARELNCLLISDIRNLRIETVKIVGKQLHPRQEEDRFDIISRDLDIQREVVNIVNPLACILKFVIPWNAGKTEYLDGVIHVQSWAKRGSAETRLWCERPYNRSKLYDHKHYEQALTYYNTVSRRKYYDYTPLILELLDGETELQYVGHCHDCFSDMCILADYLTSTNNGTLKELMRMINKHLINGIISCNRTIKHNYPSFRNKWMSVKT